MLVYTIGLVLAVILTAMSFWVANTSLLWAPGVALGLAVLAIAQMGVHLVFFLHITTGPDNTNNVLALAFGVLIVTLVVAGSLWIMANLNENMMLHAGGRADEFAHAALSADTAPLRQCRDPKFIERKRDDESPFSVSQHDHLDVRCRRLLFRCWHRGTQESDLILGWIRRSLSQELRQRTTRAVRSVARLPRPRSVRLDYRRLSRHRQNTITT